MLRFITGNIIKDRSSLVITNCDENKIQLMNKNTIVDKLKKFNQIKAVHKKCCDPKTIKKIFYSKDVQC
jgi:hypothetical protein